MKKIIYILIFLYSKLLFSQIIIINNHTDISINDKVEIFKNNQWYANVTKQEIPYGFDKKAGICRFKLQNKGQSQAFIIKIQQSRVDKIQLFVTRNNNITDTLFEINKSIGIRERQIKSVNFCYKINFNKNEIITFHLRSSRKFGMHAPVIQITNSDKFYLNEIFFSQYIFFVLGICLVISLAGFCLYLFFRVKLYFIYSLYCLFSFLVTFADSGCFHSYFPFKNFLYLNNNITAITFYCLIGIHIYLAITMLEPNKKQSYWLFKFGKYISIIFVTLALLLFLPQINEVLKENIIKFSYYIIFVMDVFLISVLVISIKNKQIAVYFYLGGFLVSIVGGTVLLLANIGLIDNINQNYDLGYALPLVEIFCILIGISIQFSNQNKKLIITQKDLLMARQKVISIQEEEQMRIAKDLHDGIGQDLMLLKQTLRKNNLELTGIESIIEDVRKVSRELYPVVLQKMGLKDAIQNLCEQIMEYYPFFVSSEINYSNKLSKEIELQIYRIVQEAINNSVKHSLAKAIRVEITENKENYLEILIKDNGIGFEDKLKTNLIKSFGMQTMSQRTKSLGGIINITTSSKGSNILVLIPLKLV